MNAPGTNRPTGSPKSGWNARLPLAIGAISLVLLLGGFGGWSLLTQISGAIIAPGRIEVEQSRQVVQHPVGGVVSEIDVKEGDLVQAGEVLLRLDDTAVKSELAIVEGQYFELMARRGLLEAERDGQDRITFDPQVLKAAQHSAKIQAILDGQRRLFAARRTSLENEISQLQERKVQITAQIDGLSAQLRALDQQYDLVAQELADQQRLLGKGLAQASRVSTLQREAARLDGLKGEIAASKAEAGGRMIENDIAILHIGTARREDAITRLRDLQYREFELSERRLVARDTLSRLIIRAPMAGIVYGLQVHALRSVIQPAQPLMYIVPNDRPLVIVSRINPIDVDQVSVGQKVMLRFTSFDQRSTPELYGRVAKVSADAFVDDVTRQSYYKAEIDPLAGEVDKLAGKILLPGMPVEAFVLTADRTQWPIS